MKWSAVIFDLDNTLIHTEKIKHHFFAQLKNSGFGTEEIEKKYADTICRKEGQNTFSRELFSEITGIPLTLDGLHAKQLLVKGTMEALRKCTNYALPTYILTLGVDAWQREKLTFAELDHFLGSEVTLLTTTDMAQGKSEHIKQLFSKHPEDCQMLLVNDKPDETQALLDLFPRLHAVLRREPEDTRYVGHYDVLATHPRVLSIFDTLETLPAYIV